MRLGVSLGYWSGGPSSAVVETLQAAERLGYSSAWSAEAYGSDAFTPLAWWGSQTQRITLGTSIAQMAARTPTAAAMAALTMDHLTGGRFVLGIGASGPQVVEGWYGQPYPRPLERTREYVEIVRKVIAREGPVTHSGRHYTLPYEGGTGLGKPLKSIVHPLRTDLPVYLAAEGPKNVALAAEIADGWFPFWFSPKMDGFYREALAEGFARPGARRALGEFEVVSPTPVVLADDAEQAADWVRPVIALYAGGMGAKSANFHADVFVRLGWGDVVEQVQAKYLAGDKAGAIAAVPLAMVEDVALVGPEAKVKDELERWRSTVVTTFVVTGAAEQLERIARVFEL